MPKRSDLRMGEKLIQGDSPIIAYRRRRQELIEAAAGLETRNWKLIAGVRLPRRGVAVYTSFQLPILRPPSARAGSHPPAGPR